MRLDSELARELAYSRVGEGFEGFKVVHNQLVDTTRWSEIRLLVLEVSGIGFWGTHYQIGATEYQDERPFEDEDPEFVRYFPKPVQTVEWTTEENK